MNPLFHSSSALTENVKTPPMTRQTLLVACPPVFVFVFHLCSCHIVVKRAVSVSLSRCAAITAIWTAIQTSLSNNFCRSTIKTHPSLGASPRRCIFPRFLFLFTLIPEIALPQEGDFLVFSLEFHLRKIYCPHDPPPLLQQYVLDYLYHLSSLAILQLKTHNDSIPII